VAALLRRLASRRRRRWIVPLALAVTTAGVAIAQRQPGSACADADSQLDDAWDGQRRAALTAAFASAHTPAAARATALTIDALDTHAQQWKGEYQAACALQPSAETDATFSCLRRRRAHLQAVATMLSEGGRDLVHRAGEIVASLESPGACAQAPAELHAAQDEEHEALGALVDRAWVRVEGGQYEAARAIAREAEAEALRLGDDEAVGHARLYLGMALARTGHFDEAETEYVEAFEGAIAHGHDEIAVRAALRMAFLEAGERGRTLEARRWLRHAQALLDRLQLPPGTLHARLHEVTAQVLENEGDDAGAREEMERALQIRTTFDAPDSLAMSTLRNNLGTLLTRQGRLQESLAMHERALADRIARVGPSHPEVAMSLLNLAQVQLYRGRWDDALASLARAEPVIAGVQGWSHPWMVNLRMVRAGTLSAMGASERAQIDAQFALTMTIVRYGDQSAQAARAWNILGGVFFDDWDFDGAQWAFDRALTLFDALGGSTELGAALVRANLGALAFRRGEIDRAETSMLAALEGIQRRFGPEHSDTGLCHVYLAGIALARDQPHEALEHLDHAERVLAGDEHRGSVYVLYHLARARAQWAAGRDRRQARQEAERALELAAPGTPDQREVEAWLASHRVEEPRP
jgi:tetratricopeptide (TPR) repeat protein